jgi:hypothetical protein
VRLAGFGLGERLGDDRGNGMVSRRPSGRQRLRRKGGTHGGLGPLVDGRRNPGDAPFRARMTAAAAKSRAARSGWDRATATEAIPAMASARNRQSPWSSACSMLSR